MGSVMDTISKISGGAAGGFTATIQEQGDKFQKKIGDAVDLGEQYAIAQLVLQGLATFAALGMLHLYAKTYKLQSRIATRKGYSSNPRRKRRRRAA